MLKSEFMQTFETNIQVTKGDLDVLNHVNNVRYVKWVNDIAERHWLKNATKDITDQYYWVLISHHIQYKNSAFLNDIIHLKTYVTRSEGVTSTRIVEMYNAQTKKLLAQSETVWCLMNSKTNKPSRISAEIVNLFN